MPITIEVCVDSLSGAIIAQSLGADRLELCVNLSIGGTTPSAGLLRQVRKVVEIPVHVLIRPRGGDFLYGQSEIAAMLSDIEFAKDEGANGIVCGALTSLGEIDAATTEKLITSANPLPFTFHRAFDHCQEPMAALQVLQSLGVEHLLTSGQMPSTAQGLPLLKEMMASSGELSIMPGGGISPENIQDILSAFSPAEIHFSGTKRVLSAMKTHPVVSMGVEDSTESRLVTDPKRLGAMIAAVRSWEATHI